MAGLVATITLFSMGCRSRWRLLGSIPANTLGAAAVVIWYIYSQRLFGRMKPHASSPAVWKRSFHFGGWRPGAGRALLLPIRALSLGTKSGSVGII
jgi:hypothetical protein